MLTDASRAVIDGRRDAAVLTLTVTLEGASAFDPELEARVIDLEDRIGALDGRVSVEHDQSNELRVRAEIPCAW
jgi:hypothetical protein